MERRRISDERAHELLMDAVNAGEEWAFAKNAFFEHLLKSYKIEKRRALDLWDRYYPAIQAERNEVKKKAILEKLKADTVKRTMPVEDNSMSIIERKNRASAIARGQAWAVEGNLIIPSAKDSLAALEYLSRIDGDFAPERQDISVDNSGSVNIEVAEVRALLEELQKPKKK